MDRETMRKTAFGARVTGSQQRCSGGTRATHVNDRLVVTSIRLVAK